jgi:hypothetical protein
MPVSNMYSADTDFFKHLGCFSCGLLIPQKETCHVGYSGKKKKALYLDCQFHKHFTTNSQLSIDESTVGSTG